MSNQDIHENLDFPINQHLLEEATVAMEQWRTIKDRLKKIEEHKENVSENVYKRVKQDYDGRLADATTTLLNKKEEIDKELGTLNETRDSIFAKLDERRKSLEEIKFRNSLGEFEPDEFQQNSAEAQEKISKFETILGAVDSNIKRYEAVFEGEAELFAAPQEEVHEEDLSEAAHISELDDEDEEAGNESNDLDDNGADYFSPSHNLSEDTNPHNIESTTAKVKIDPAKFESTGDISKQPRLVIISGENAGAAYPLKGTMSLGRAETCGVSLKDAKASRQHSQVKQHGNEFVISDLSSSNGTYVNKEKIDEHVLSNGDEILIGDTLLQFQTES